MKRTIIAVVLGLALVATGTGSAVAQTQAEKQQIINQTQQLLTSLAGTLNLVQQNVSLDRTRTIVFNGQLNQMIRELSRINPSQLDTAAGRAAVSAMLADFAMQLNHMNVQIQRIDTRREAISDFLEDFADSFGDFTEDLIDFLE